MDKEIKEYLDRTGKLLSGQIRGVINDRAKELNLELIQITLSSVFDQGFQLGKSYKESENVIDQLKKDLGIDGKDNTQKTDSK